MLIMDGADIMYDAASSFVARGSWPGGGGGQGDADAARPHRLEQPGGAGVCELRSNRSRVRILRRQPLVSEGGGISNVSQLFRTANATFERTIIDVISVAFRNKDTFKTVRRANDDCDVGVRWFLHDWRVSVVFLAHILNDAQAPEEREHAQYASGARLLSSTFQMNLRQFWSLKH
jgi:hypothetical protein